MSACQILFYRIIKIRQLFFFLHLQNLRTHTQTDVTLLQAASKFVDYHMEAEEQHPPEVSVFLLISPLAPDQLTSPTTPHIPRLRDRTHFDFVGSVLCFRISKLQ